MEGHKMTLNWWSIANFLRDIHDLKPIFPEDQLQVADSNCGNATYCIASKTNNNNLTTFGDF